MTATAELRARGARARAAAPDVAPAPAAAVDTSPRAGRWVSPTGLWQSNQPTHWRLVDGLLGVVLLGGVVTLANLEHMPEGVEAFLETRLSLKNALLLTAFAWAWPTLLTFCGLHDPKRLRTGEGEWPRLLIAGVIGCALAMVFPLTSQSGLTTPGQMLLFGATLVPAAGLLRSGARAVEKRRVRSRPRQVLLVGSGELTRCLCRQIVADPTRDTTVVGFVDSDPQGHLSLCTECGRCGTAGTGPLHLGGIADLEQILMHRVVDDVLIGLPVKSRYDDIQQSLAACARVGVPASYSADLFGGGLTHSKAVERAAPVLSLSATPSSELLAVKRAMDVAGAAVLLVLLAPVMLAVAVAVKLTSPGPVLFTQGRYGYMKRLFRMYKFRTMVANAEQLHAALEGQNEASGPVFKIRNDPRITPIGRFLRRTSLDELPQIWHVLTGEMSLVGPRPMATRDVGLFPEPWLVRRFSVRPGLTCLWQISGRSNVGFDQWIALDLEYIDHWSLWLDLTILLRTPLAVVRGTGAV